MDSGMTTPDTVNLKTLNALRNSNCEVTIYAPGNHKYKLDGWLIVFRSKLNDLYLMRGATLSEALAKCDLE